MKNEVYRVTAACLIALGSAAAVAYAQVGGAGAGGGVPGGGFGGGGFGGGFGGGLGGGGWRAGGGVAGGGWHGGGFNGAHMGGVGGFPNAPAGVGFGGGMGRLAGIPGFGPGFGGAFPGRGMGFNGGMPGLVNRWSNAHPYSWYNGSWHNHWYGNGFCGYRSLPLTSASAPSAPWDRFGSGSGMGGYLSPNYPLGWGSGGWGTGSPWYGSGYQSYYNPYYDPGITTTYNYGRPIPAPTGVQVADTDNPIVGLAIARFRTGDYAKALSLLDGVIRLQPYDAAAHELRGLVLFAMENYGQAAATGPGWDWTTLSSIYSDMQVYQSQLAALEKYVADHPKKADARFLLAYHYITAGNADAAKEQLEQVVALVPGDKLAASLLHMSGGGGAAAPPAAANAAVPPTAVPPAAPAGDVKPVDPAALVGHWQAKRDDGAAFILDLTPDKKFTWRFTQRNEVQTLAGEYTLDKATLALNGPRGAMVAQVSIDAANHLAFKPVGGPANDPGLTFVK